MPSATEEFANPPAPVGHELPPGGSEGKSRLTNADFRRLMMTPRSVPTAGLPTAGSHRGSGNVYGHHHGEAPEVGGAPEASGSGPAEAEAGENPESRREKRRKKKMLYARMKREEEDTLKELALKYRDRAKERREGGAGMGDEPLSSQGGYRAVAPDAKSGLDAAERRRRAIQESKFLGGDMEHTHLVKGLDYALLQKVRSELTSKEKTEDDELEVLLSQGGANQEEEPAPPTPSLSFRTNMARNIYGCLFATAQKRGNEFFLPGRMAYVVDLEESEFLDNDVPTTLIRSKADCPDAENVTTLSTNEIVINKLAQILSYLRAGAKSKKAKKKELKSLAEKQAALGLLPAKAMDIFEGVGTDFEISKAKDKTKANQQRSYFGSATSAPSTKDDDAKRRSDKSSYDWKSAMAKLEAENASGRRRGKDGAGGGGAEGGASSSQARLDSLSKKLQEMDKVQDYAECYPGFSEMHDAVDDSDEEVDYSKMDMGNKKGPIGRWDFDSQEEYSNYMSQKEALPKAAFQYGVKMADGRKTRRIPGKEKNEKAVLDREWRQIQQIIEKRKVPASSTGAGEPNRKAARY